MYPTNLIAGFRYTRSGIILVIMVLSLLLILSACGDRASSYTDLDADSTSTAVPAPSSPPVEDVHTVEILLAEDAIDMPDSLLAGPTIFRVTNTGSVARRFEILGQDPADALSMTLQPNEMTMFDLNLQPGEYIVYGPKEGQEDQQEATMRLTLTVHPPDQDAI